MSALLPPAACRFGLQSVGDSAEVERNPGRPWERLDDTANQRRDVLARPCIQVLAMRRSEAPAAVGTRGRGVIHRVREGAPPPPAIVIARGAPVPSSFPRSARSLRSPAYGPPAQGSLVGRRLSFGWDLLVVVLEVLVQQ
jgi:hypothetical protein